MMEKITYSKETMDFLLFSYFGITMESKYDEVLKAVIQKAYSDATQQGAYNALFEKDDKNASDNTTKAKNQCIEELKEKLTQLTVFQSQKAYDDWHKELCQSFVEFFKKNLGIEEYFTYGNAQKWVNMTMKYLLLLCDILNKESDLMKKVESLSTYVHVPVDSYIIEEVWKNETVTLPLKPKCRGRNGFKYASEKVVPWSKWNETQYDEFQKSLRKYIVEQNYENPIQWENKEWIKIAKKRKWE